MGFPGKGKKEPGAVVPEFNPRGPKAGFHGGSLPKRRKNDSPFPSALAGDPGATPWCGGAPRVGGKHSESVN